LFHRASIFFRSFLHEQSDIFNKISCWKLQDQVIYIYFLTKYFFIGLLDVVNVSTDLLDVAYVSRCSLDVAYISRCSLDVAYVSRCSLDVAYVSRCSLDVAYVSCCSLDVAYVSRCSLDVVCSVIVLYSCSFNL
jgi:hypothetical protein